MPTTISLSKEFIDSFEQSTHTTMMNVSERMVVEMKKLAPFARPSQYKGKYRGTPGALMRSIARRGSGFNREIYATVPYAKRRNFENFLNPQTKGYVERAVNNVMRDKSSQWWQAT